MSRKWYESQVLLIDSEEARLLTLLEEPGAPAVVVSKLDDL